MGKHACGKKGNKHLTLTLASVYHPCTKTGADNIYACFLDTLDTLLSKLSADNKIIMGADVNANIGKFDDLQSSEFQSTLGPHCDNNVDFHVLARSEHGILNPNRFS